MYGDVLMLIAVMWGAVLWSIAVICLGNVRQTSSKQQATLTRLFIQFSSYVPVLFHSICSCTPTLMNSSKHGLFAAQACATHSMHLG